MSAEQTSNYYFKCIHLNLSSVPLRHVRASDGHIAFLPNTSSFVRPSSLCSGTKADRNREKERERERSESKDSKKEYKNCIGCKCEDCVKMRKNAKELNVQLCDGYELDQEILVNYTEKVKQVMI